MAGLLRFVVKVVSVVAGFFLRTSSMPEKW